MRKILEERKAEVSNYCSSHGRSTVNIKCPFCGTITTAYVWSIRGGGKMCPNSKCDVILTGIGTAQKLFPKLTDRQRDLLKDIVQFNCANIGDGWHPNKRILNSLIEKGYVFYGKFPPNEPFKEIGFYPTELGKSYFK